MTHTQFKRLRPIADLITIKSNLGVYWDNLSIYSVWVNAIAYNKMQNKNFKEGYFDEVVKSFNLYCEETNDLKWFSIKSKKVYPRLKWFKILVAVDSYLTYQQIKEVINQ